jgi:hypothetical protein
MAIQALYPEVQPSLNLSFALTKKLDPRITFARASAARYYDGKTVAKAEENLVTQSQTAIAPAGATVTNNTAVAPNGTTTAATLTEDTSTGTHSCGSNAVNLAALPHTFSFFAKPNGRSWVVLRYQGISKAFFDVTTGAIGTLGAGVTASIEASAGGWYRCIATFTPSTGASNIFFRTATADNVDSYTGDGVSGLFLWGFQIEARSTATAYTPTTTQPITNYIPTLLTATDNVARFDHNPVTGESLGLLIEESRTNTVLQSEAFATTWDAGTGNPIVSVNTAIAPDGTLTADKLIEGTTNGGQNILQTNVSFPSVGQYAYSVYVKKAERFKVTLRESTSTGAAVLFDVNAGTVLSTAGGGTPFPSGLIQNVGNGWYRCTMILAQGTAANRTVRIYVVPDAVTTASPSIDDYTGDGYSGIYIWGAQLEAGAFPTSYIPTVASQVTRSADAASMTGANFSSWYSQGEGTLYAEAKTSFAALPASTSFRRIATILNSADNSRVRLTYQFDGSAAASIATNGVSQALISSGTNTSNYVKLGVSYQKDNVGFSRNASALQTDTSAVIASDIDRLLLGNATDANPLGCLNGHIRKVAYYSKALPSNLVAITG